MNTVTYRNENNTPLRYEVDFEPVTQIIGRFLQQQDIFLFTKASKSAVGPAQPPL